MIQLLSIVVIGYFINGQYHDSQITAIKYLLIPLVAFFHLGFTVQHLSNRELVIVVIASVLAAGIGYMQAHYTVITPARKVLAFYRNATNQEMPIYTKTVLARGVSVYLIGWGMLIILEMLVEFVQLHAAVTFENALTIIRTDIFGAIFTITDNLGSGNPTLWALTAFSSLSYSITLSRTHASVHAAIYDHQQILPGE